MKKITQLLVFTALIAQASTASAATLKKLGEVKKGSNNMYTISIPGMSEEGVVHEGVSENVSWFIESSSSADGICKFYGFTEADKAVLSSMNEIQPSYWSAFGKIDSKGKFTKDFVYLGAEPTVTDTMYYEEITCFK